MTFITEIEKSVSLGNRRDHEEPRQYSAKRAMLEVSQYPT
jgi:hypothetical protein